MLKEKLYHAQQLATGDLIRDIEYCTILDEIKEQKQILEKKLN